MSGFTLLSWISVSYPRGSSIAAAFTHLSATAWGAFQIYNTGRFHDDFKRLTTDGACGINLLPNYWQSRAFAEIPSLAFSAAAMLVSCFLSFKLIKVRTLVILNSTTNVDALFSHLDGKLSSALAPPGRSTGFTSSS